MSKYSSNRPVDISSTFPLAQETLASARDHAQDLVKRPLQFPLMLFANPALREHHMDTHDAIACRPLSILILLACRSFGSTTDTETVHLSA